ncbi:hypothetical protein K469DRAFT_608542, partial [Zopfia rhizophila CBS 207.26]
IVEPSQVRLLPGPDDPYCWRVVPEKQHLFSKKISDHSIGAYKYLCEGVGTTFEAISARRRNSSSPQDAVGLDGSIVSTIPLESGISFSARINRLQEENARLNLDMYHLRGVILKCFQDIDTVLPVLEELKEISRNV